MSRVRSIANKTLETSSFQCFPLTQSHPDKTLRSAAARAEENAAAFYPCFGGVGRKNLNKMQILTITRARLMAKVGGLGQSLDFKTLFLYTPLTL